MPDTNQIDPLDHGVFKRLLNDDGTIHTRGWNYAVENRQHVGTCRWCGGYLKPAPTTVAGQITWYSADCISCGGVIAAPNGEFLRRSARHDEMPKGYWENRQASPKK